MCTLDQVLLLHNVVSLNHTFQCNQKNEIRVQYVASQLIKELDERKGSWEFYSLRRVRSTGSCNLVGQLFLIQVNYICLGLRIRFTLDLTISFKH